MPNLGAALKDEISRISRKSQKAGLRGLQRASADHRRQIAKLRKEIAALRLEVRGVRKAATRVAAPAATSAHVHRFQVRGLKSFRARLGLSAADFGTLAGVSGQTIYNWEMEKSTPRAAQLQTLAALRGLGKREAMTRLAAAAATPSAPALKKTTHRRGATSSAEPKRRSPAKRADRTDTSAASA